MSMSIALIWFRQDLRCHDNPAFAAACNQHQAVIPLYIYDQQTLPLTGAQTWWAHHSLSALEKKLQELGLQLVLRRGSASELLAQLVSEYNIDAVYWNRCYEPAAIARDKSIKAMLKNRGVTVTSSNGSLLNEPWEIKNKTGDYFKVFTPFWKHCLQKNSTPQPFIHHGNPQSTNVPGDRLEDWSLLPKINWAADFGQHWQPGEEGALKKLDAFIDNHLDGYKDARDFPALDVTSKLSPHLHFGEISPWQIRRAIDLAMLNKKADLRSIECFLSELGWREFSYYLLYHFPALPEANFKSRFDAFSWNNDTELLRRWQQGLTGFPIVDAGMRELWATGYMHNRVRMITASFLIKDLLIDWRLGAAWFSTTLVDADLASNSASWQWVAGSGADAAPYFRIFNPVLQSEKFDPQGKYIRRWVPELANVTDKWIHQPWCAPQCELGMMLGKEYPAPIIDHAKARASALMNYQMINKDDA